MVLFQQLPLGVRFKMVEPGFVTSDNLQQEALGSIVVCRKRSVFIAFLIFLGLSDSICGTKRAQTLP